MRTPALLMVCGIAFTAAALTGHRQKHVLGLSIPMILCAIAAFALPVPLMVLIGIMFVVGGVLTATIMRAQLLQSAAAHETH